MPLYENECRKCGATGTYFQTIAKCKRSPKCEKCGGRTKQIISAVRGFGDIAEYVSPATGRVVRGRRERREDLERSGCRPYEGLDSEAREAKKVRAEKEKKLEAKLDDVLGRTIEDLDASNRLDRVGPRDEPLPDHSGMRVLS